MSGYFLTLLAGLTSHNPQSDERIDCRCRVRVYEESYEIVVSPPSTMAVLPCILFIRE
jgi:hypothetical protein